LLAGGSSRFRERKRGVRRTRGQMSDTQADDADSSATKLLLRIQRDRDRRVTDQYIQREQMKLRAAARMGYLEQLKNLKDELAVDPLGHPDRAELEAMIADREATITRLDGAPFDPSQLDALRAPRHPSMGSEIVEKPKVGIDRKGLAEAWEATLRHGDQTVKLETNRIQSRIYRAWRARKKFDDDSPTATAIVHLLVQDLKAAGVDVVRFGVN
jgi:hypothetical protein